MSQLQREIHERHMRFLNTLREKAVDAGSVKKEPENEPADKTLLEDFTPRWKIDARRICQENGVTLEQVLAPGRNVLVSAIRLHIYWHMSVNLGMSLEAIGVRVRREHTTVLHGIRSHLRKMAAK